MATFVGFVSEDEQVEELGTFVNRIINSDKPENYDIFLKECEILLSENKNLELLLKIAEQLNIVIEKAIPKEAEGAFMIFLSLLLKLGPETTKKFLPKILDIVTSSKEKTPVRIKILNYIYNSVEDGTLRYETLIRLLKYAKDSHSISIIIPHFDSLYERSKQWGLSLEQSRELIKTFRDSTENKKSRFKWTEKYLSSFAEKDSNSEVLREAAQAIIQAVSLPELYQFDSLTDLAPIKLLENSKEYSNFYELLKIFIEGDIKSFKAFSSKNPDFIKTPGFDFEEAQQKIRLLTLASLASNDLYLTYDLISKSLEIEDSQVELWVVTAVTENIIDAKIDQFKRIVSINRCFYRTFTKAEWKKLNESLIRWKTNVQQIRKTLHNCVEQQIDLVSKIH